MAISQEAVNKWVADNPTATNAEILAAINASGATVEQVATAYGTTVTYVQKEIIKTEVAAPTYVPPNAAAVKQWLIDHPSASAEDIYGLAHTLQVPVETISAATGLSVTDLAGGYKAVVGLAANNFNSVNAVTTGNTATLVSTTPSQYAKTTTATTTTNLAGQYTGDALYSISDVQTYFTTLQSQLGRPLSTTDISNALTQFKVSPTLLQQANPTLYNQYLGTTISNVSTTTDVTKTTTVANVATVTNSSATTVTDPLYIAKVQASLVTSGNIIYAGDSLYSTADIKTYFTQLEASLGRALTNADYIAAMQKFDVSPTAVAKAYPTTTANQIANLVLQSSTITTSTNTANTKITSNVATTGNVATTMSAADSAQLAALQAKAAAGTLTDAEKAQMAALVAKASSTTSAVTSAANTLTNATGSLASVTGSLTNVTSSASNLLGQAATAAALAAGAYSLLKNASFDPAAGVANIEAGFQNVVSSIKNAPAAISDAYTAAQDKLKSAFSSTTPTKSANPGEAATKAALANKSAQADIVAKNNGDWRVKLSIAESADYLYNADDPGILKPLASTNGIIFPYTPQIQTSHQARYSQYDLTHSNYRGYFYSGSNPGDITINGIFTAQDTKEAEYLLAVMHFLRSATKMFYGQDTHRGSPPPLVFLSGLGDYQFNKHPCVISNVQYTLPADVDYIRAYSASGYGTSAVGVGNNKSNNASLFQQASQALNAVNSALSSPVESLLRLKSSGITRSGTSIMDSKNLQFNKSLTNSRIGAESPTYVPTKIDISITLYPMQSRKQVAQDFSFDKFANGSLLKGGFW